jgi:hypothetical protein
MPCMVKSLNLKTLWRSKDPVITVTLLSSSIMSLVALEPESCIVDLQGA